MSGMQEKQGHTPGPWHLCAHLEDHDKCSCGYRGGIWGSDREHIICEMGSVATLDQEGLEPPRYPREVEFANARLIAAAPTLLDTERQNLATMQVTRQRLREWGKSTAELDIAISQTAEVIANAEARPS
jgi:hypothetical protein